MLEYSRQIDAARRLNDANEIMKACLDKTKCYIEMSKQFCDWQGISLSFVDKGRCQL